MELKRIDVLSCAKIAALLYAALGFVGGALFSLFTLAGAVGSAASEGNYGNLAMPGFVLGAGAVICAPVLYGIIGGVFAAIGAALYNLFAGMIGGIRVEVVERGASESGR